MVLIRNLLLGLFLASTALAYAAEKPPAPPAAAVKAAAETEPVLSELGPRRAAFTEFVQKSLGELTQRAELQKLRENYEALAAQLEEEQAQFADMGDPASWCVDRLSLASSQYRQLRKGFTSLQQELTARQQVVEGIQKRLLQEKEFWNKWAKAIKEQKLKVSPQTEREVHKDLETIENLLKKTAAAIVALQEKVGSSQQQVAAELEVFEQALAQLRKETFRKNAFSFFSPRYYAQFDNELWNQAKTGFFAALKFDPNDLQSHGWLLGLMCVTLSVGTLLILRFRTYLAEAEAEGWQFVLLHPLATACFASIVVFTPLLTAPPELLRFALLSAAVIAVTTLAASLTDSPRQARLLVVAAVFLLLTTGFRLMNLPQPFYRLYLTLLSFSMVPILVWQVRASRAHRGPREARFFRAVLRIATVVLLISFAAQIGGYVNLSFWLLQATFETGMVILFAHMALRLGNGCIQFLLNHQRWARTKFFKEYAHELAVRLGKLLKILISLYAIFYLLPEWRLFASGSDVWGFFSGYALQLGTVTISLSMVILALISLYLAMQVSWLLQAMSETQVFYRKSVDRGVRDAIKKLIHYAMVLIGLLFALSLLGMKLQNFVVIVGALGVGIGFGLQDIVNNFLSGLILLFERPIKVGDCILIDDQYATVVKIGLRSTVVETFDQSEVIVPNGQMISQKVTNWTLSNRSIRIVLPVGVAYGSDVEKVMAILLEAGTTHPEVLENPEPSPIFIAFGDSSLDFELRVWIADIDRMIPVKSALLVHIDRRFREENVEIPFPQRDLHLRSVEEKVLQQLGKPSA